MVKNIIKDAFNWLCKIYSVKAKNSKTCMFKFENVEYLMSASKSIISIENKAKHYCRFFKIIANLFST